MGPIILLDKSAFQRLSGSEHTYLHKHYMENLTPVLAVEILSDLRKVATSKRPMTGIADSVVGQLAEKFGGSGPTVNENYVRLLAGNLLGYEVVMTGQIVVGHGVRSKDGRGIIIDLHPINEAILRWRNGTFREWEREAAGWIRQASQNIRFDDFQSHLLKHHVIVPKAESLDELSRVVNALMNDASLQLVWLEWAIALTDMDSHETAGARYRWRVEKAASLERLAPFAGHCIRVLLTLVAAVRANLIKWNTSHARDAEYLFYLPFCQVFSSSDKVHVSLAPHLLRSNQAFIHADALKADLKAILEFWKSLTDDQQRRAHWALGMYPPPLRDSTTWHLWRRFRGVLRPGANLANRLPETEREVALAELRTWYDSAGYVWDARESPP